MSDRLTGEELGRLVSEPPERIAEWRALGLIGRADSETFGFEDLARARLIQLLIRRGVALSAVVRAEQEEGVIAQHIDRLWPEGVGPSYSVAEAAARVGMDDDLVRRLLGASGITTEDELYDHDLDAVRALKVILDAGFPVDALLQLARVYADSLDRVADSEIRLFHFYVHERLKLEGLSGRPLIDTVRAASKDALPLVENFLRYFHRRGWQRSLREDLVLHAREYAGDPLETPAVLGQIRVALAFVDLSGFTPLAEAMGDEMAARVLDRFSQIVREIIARFDGRVVKQIGDAFMLVFPESRPAVSAVLEIDRVTSAEPQFPAVRSGAHHGPLLYREGDYYGTTVNIAARIAAEAERHQLLVSAAVRTGAGSVPEVEFVPLGRRRLRGLTEDIEVFAARRSDRDRPERRVIDPVCGMELDESEAAATLSLAGRNEAFCSQQCLQLFAAAPARYARTPVESS